MCSRPARKGRLAATVTPSRARPSRARSSYCGGGGEQRRVIGEEDVAGALVDAAARGVAGVVVKLTPGDVVAMGECCGEMFLRFTELLRGVRRRQWLWLLTRFVDGAAEVEVWQRHGAWRRGGDGASGLLLWLWSGRAKP